MDNKKECKLKVKRATTCPNIKNTYEGYDSETWKCSICGLYFKLYYDEMQ